MSPIKRIQRAKVSENKRLSFLPKYFGKEMIVAENTIYEILRELCPKYDGAYWNFYELDNQGFYLAPDLEEKLTLQIQSNGYVGSVSADAAGIIVCLFVISQLCWIKKNEKMIDAYYRLRDFALEHTEGSEIFAAID